MDPLSIAASTIGLCTAAIQINAHLKAFVDSSKDAPASARHALTEVTGIYACLNQLDAFLSGRWESPSSRKSLVMLEQVIIVFTDCVSMFSELEQTIDSLKTNGPMRVIDRVKWAMKEKGILKLLTRLQTSKASLNLMLNILTCTSTNSAEATTRELTTVVQQLLKSNINMARRLKNIERMHPAMNPSACPSRTMSLQTGDVRWLEDPEQTSEDHYEKELKTSPVYKRPAFSRLRASHGSSNAASGPSSFSGLSLSDVSNVTAMALPISSSELWNHYRYTTETRLGTGTDGSNLDAWYYPPARKSAFIRTAYFDGHYTNQYAQAKFTGHLIYRRFDLTGPDRSPRFKEGMTISSTIKQDEPCMGSSFANKKAAKLEDTSRFPIGLYGPLQINTEYQQDQKRQQPEHRYGSCYARYSFTSWGQGVLRLLESIG
ncbi:MAG: hypothetical protein Q9208_002280 [Pyrenodesmia sp. 3 TL-2023]